MRKFIDGLGGVTPSNKRPMEMLCDNEPALAIVGDRGILREAKHFQWKYHYIHEVIQQGEIVLKKVYTDDNVADPFTKPMPFNKHFEHVMKIGIVHASISRSIDDVARLFFNVSMLYEMNETFTTFVEKCAIESSSSFFEDLRILLFVVRVLEYDIWGYDNDTSGQIKILPPRTAEEIVARERERETRTTLLMALPEDHLASSIR
ncbi:hypothetical protein Tco_1245463 [Tanacetum coccineum]